MDGQSQSTSIGPKAPATTYQQSKDIATKTAMSTTEEKLVPKPLSKPLVLRGCCCCRTYFENPWPSCPPASFGNVLKAIPEWRRKPPFPKPEEIERQIKVVTPDIEQLNQPPTDSLQLTWLGHATCLVQLDGITVLTDPIMSQRCSFSQYIGPKRYTRVPLPVAELPKIDVVVISHNHYDHLDKGTVKQLYAKFGDQLKWFVPLGIKRWFGDLGIKNVEEMNWWDSTTFASQTGTSVQIACVPAQHFSNRGLHDSGWTLWSGWVFLGRESRFFFAGDTAYCEAFEEIGREFGPFTAAAIPIGAYAPRVMMKRIHVNPEEAVKIHQDVRSQRSIGIHWGTFDLAAEGVFEPRDTLKECTADAGMNPEEFNTISIGETINVR